MSDGQKVAIVVALAFFIGAAVAFAVAASSSIIGAFIFLAAGVIMTGLAATFFLYGVGGEDLVRDLLDFIAEIFKTTAKALTSVFRWLEKQ